MAFKTFTAGETLTASDVNTYLAKQAVIVCTSGTRPGSPVEGMAIYETDTDNFLTYNGTIWTLPKNLAGGELGYAQVTTSQTGITTTTDLTGLSVAVTVLANRVIRISAAMRVACTVANDGVLLSIMEGSTQLADGLVTLPVAGRAGTLPATSVVVAPSAGSHTYKLSLARYAGTGTVGTDAAATYPAWVLVEDIGAA